MAAKERSGRQLSADRIAALAPLRRAKLSESGKSNTRMHLHGTRERAKRCGSSDHAAAAEGVEDYGFQGGFGVDGGVAHAMAGAETLNGAAPLGQALAVEANRIIVQRYGDRGATLAVDQADVTAECWPQLLRR